jgi:rod shape-determining protein MreC
VTRPGARATSVLVLLAFLGLHAHARSKSVAELNGGDRILLAVTGPLQYRLTAVARGLSSGFEHYVLAVGASKENELLKHQLAGTSSSLSELENLRSENDRLRRLIGLRESAPGQVVAASVIGRGTSSRFHTLRIDRGSDLGVEPGMAVVSVSGVVGQILRSSRGYSDVLLLTDGLSSAGAMMQNSGLRGLAVGDSSNRLQLDFLRRNSLDGISSGDLVVSSGEDGVFPEGVPLGRVVLAEAPETGLFLNIVVEPAAALQRVEEVLVVVDAGLGPFHIPLPDELQDWERDGASVVDEEEL